MKNLRKNKKGFTLVEVIVVLVILAILIAIAVPSVMKYIDDANDAKYLAEASAAKVAVEAELTKDYGDDKKLNYSIYTKGSASGSVDDMKEAVKEACGFEVNNITYTPAIAADGETNPNDIKTYTITFVSPSNNETKTVEITKNGTSKIVENPTKKD